MRYQVGGSLHSDDPTYSVRQADEQLYTSLQAGEFCYALNPRQMGKSSLLHRTSHRLQKQGYACVYLDMTQLTEQVATPRQWYRSLITVLYYRFNLTKYINLKYWWNQQADLSPMQQLHRFMEDILLPGITSDRIFIFIDEIDSLLSLSFPVSDFFAWIRHCYEYRSYNAAFNRLRFALFGVATPSALMADPDQSPFQIGTAIELHGFRLHEVTPLLKGLEPHVSQPEVVMQEILRWTNGHPFLTQKLCYLVVLQSVKEVTANTGRLSSATKSFRVEQLIQSCVIQHWELQDEPEHLRTIRDRLLSHAQHSRRQLKLYQQVLEAEKLGERNVEENIVTAATLTSSSFPSPIPVDNSLEQANLLLSGLVEVHNGCLRIQNLIYRAVFNAEWVKEQLNNLRPCSQLLDTWSKMAYAYPSALSNPSLPLLVGCDSKNKGVL